MKIAIVSDIHGDIEAFKIFMDIMEKENVSRVLNLGDFVRGEDPDSIMETIMKDNRFLNIRGNHEDGYCKEVENKYVKWIEKQDYKKIVDIDGVKILMVHSRYESNKAAPLLYDGGTLDQFMSDYPNDVDLICFGHTHIQLFIENFHGKKILNPGSLGLAVDGKINFAIIEIEKGDLNYKFYKLER